jgi:hypothetical protein
LGFGVVAAPGRWAEHPKEERQPMRQAHRPDWEALVDAHPLVQAADAHVREVLEVVIAGLLPVTEYGAALLVWLDARRRARAELRLPLIQGSSTPTIASREVVA